MKTICGCDLKKEWRMVTGEDGKGIYVATCGHGTSWTSVIWDGRSEYVIWDEMKRPVTVCLCGSTRFSRAFQMANLDETLRGNIVLTIGCDTKSDEDLFRDMDPDEMAELKERLDVLHFRKIDFADEILVLNVAGYIGESTQRELDYARALGKRVRFLEEVAE